MDFSEILLVLIFLLIPASIIGFVARKKRIGFGWGLFFSFCGVIPGLVIVILSPPLAKLPSPNQKDILYNKIIGVILGLLGLAIFYEFVKASSFNDNVDILPVLGGFYWGIAAFYMFNRYNRHKLIFEKTNKTDAVQSKSNSDLLKMIYELDQWSPEMLTAVEKELLKRNILPTDIGERRQKMIDAEDIELSRGKEASLAGQVFGWLTVFGLLGIIFGYNYSLSKVRSKYSDKKYFRYNEDSRKNGSYLFYTSLLLSAAAILYKLGS